MDDLISPFAERGNPLSASSRNPLSLRIYKTLATNLKDESTREALERLSQFYQSDTETRDAGVHIQNHTHEDSDSEGEGQSSAQARKARHTLPISSELAERARKDGRRDMERQLIENSTQFLHSFRALNDKLNSLELHVDDMRARCNDAHFQLTKSTESSRTLLDKAAGLRDQRDATLTRQWVIGRFLHRFTLSDEEVETIYSHDIPVGRRLFATMARADAIRADCQLLLGGAQGGEDIAGGEIMQRTAEQLDFAYAKVQRWCSHEFRRIGKDQHVEVSSVMREAVRRLQAKPDILSAALSDLSVVRQQALLNAFLVALTRGGPSGLPRPIELHAHDPIRYVGDMLAWVHQAMATEHEFLLSLFGLGNEKRMVGTSWRQTNSDNPTENGWISELMDQNLDKLCNPLRARVQQTINSQEGSITAYKISNLLSFYLITLRRTIGAEAGLSETLKSLHDHSIAVFFNKIEAQGRSLTRFVQPAEDDLQPPLALRDTAQILREILGIYDTSVSEVGDPFERTEEEKQFDEHSLSRIISSMIPLVLEMCSKMAESRADLKPLQRIIFVVNCETYLQSILSPYAFVKAHLGSLEAEAEQHTAQIKQWHSDELLVESGISGVIGAMRSNDDKTPMARLPDSDPAAVAAALDIFDRFLTSLDVVTSPRLSAISSPTLLSQIHRAALQSIGRAYGELTEAVKDPTNKYEFSSTLLGSKRPFGQMSVLWQILSVADSPQSIA